MTVRTRDDSIPTSADPQQPLGRAEEISQARDVDAVGGDAPVLEAVDTSGVTQTSHSESSAQSLQTTEVDPLFGQDAAADYRTRWDVVQRSFVDDPQQAVRAGDKLVTEVIQTLSETFTEQRIKFEKAAHPDQPSTENLRLALRRYRSFFERLLTV
jgi:hypothetical protein